MRTQERVGLGRRAYQILFLRAAVPEMIETWDGSTSKHLLKNLINSTLARPLSAGAFTLIFRLPSSRISVISVFFA